MLPLAISSKGHVKRVLPCRDSSDCTPKNFVGETQAGPSGIHALPFARACSKFAMVASMSRTIVLPLMALTLFGAFASNAQEGAAGEARRYVVIPSAASMEASGPAIEVAATVESTVRAGGADIVLGRVGMPADRIASKIRNARTACREAETAFLELETEAASERNETCIKGLMGRLDLVNDPSAVARAFILRGTLATLLGRDKGRLPSFERALALDAAVSLEGLFLPKGDLEAIDTRQSELMFTAPGVLHFESNVPAAVYVDGRFYGPTPLDVRIVAGKHEWALRRPGYQREMGTIDVADDTVTINKDLAALPIADAVAAESQARAKQPRFWEAKVGQVSPIAGAPRADFAIFSRVAEKRVDLVLIDMKSQAPVAHEHIPIEEELTSTRPAIAVATKRLLKIKVGAPPLATEAAPVPEETPVVVAAADPPEALADESDGSGVLLWGGVAAASTLAVIGAAAAVTAAILLVPPPAAAPPADRNPFAGGDGQARRRVGLGL